MVSQAQIKEWIPGAIASFRQYFPLGTVPDIYIGTPKKVLGLRAELVQRTNSPAVDCELPYKSVMEFIHGDSGDAILIQQKLIAYDEAGFRYALWHELGHCFACYNESPGTDHMLELTSKENDEIDAYGLWAEFIAESIAQYICDKEYPCSVFNDSEWRFMFMDLYALLDAALTAYISNIDYPGLSHFFALLLMDITYRQLGDAAAQGKLSATGAQSDESWNKPFNLFEKLISTQHESYRKPLTVLYELLTKQTRKEAFWEIDDAFLKKLCDIVSDLSEAKISRELAAFAERIHEEKRME